MGKTSYFLYIGEAAQYLGVCTKTLKRWDKMGHFKPNYDTSLKIK
jgi:DNA-binding transcriptional MerR regulator